MTSYLEKVERGLTGPNAEFPVCVPTAFEQLSPHSFRDATYLTYIGYVTIDATKGVHKRFKNQCMITALDMIANDAGLDGWKDVGFENVAHPRSFERLMRKLVKGKFGIILDIDAPYDARPEDDSQIVVWKPEDEPHAAGAVPLTECGSYLQLQSSWLPESLQGPMDASEIFEHLVHQSLPSWKGFPFHDANVTFFPLTHSAPTIPTRNLRK